MVRSVRGERVQSLGSLTSVKHWLASCNNITQPHTIIIRWYWSLVISVQCDRLCIRCLVQMKEINHQELRRATIIDIWKYKLYSLYIIQVVLHKLLWPKGLDIKLFYFICLFNLWFLWLHHPISGKILSKLLSLSCDKSEDDITWQNFHYDFLALCWTSF